MNSWSGTETRRRSAAPTPICVNRAARVTLSRRWPRTHCAGQDVLNIVPSKGTAMEHGRRQLRQVKVLLGSVDCVVLFCAFETAASWQHCVDSNTTSARLSKLGATPAAQVFWRTDPSLNKTRKDKHHKSKVASGHVSQLWRPKKCGQVTCAAGGRPRNTLRRLCRGQEMTHQSDITVREDPEKLHRT